MPLPVQDTVLRVRRGATLRRVWTWRGVDLTGATARLQVRPARGAASLWLDATVGAGLAIVVVPATDTTPVASRIELTVTPALTDLALPARGEFDLDVTHPDGTTTPLATGLAFLIDHVIA